MSFKKGAILAAALCAVSGSVSAEQAYHPNSENLLAMYESMTLSYRETEEGDPEGSLGSILHDNITIASTIKGARGPRYLSVETPYGSITFYVDFTPADDCPKLEGGDCPDTVEVTDQPPGILVIPGHTTTLEGQKSKMIIYPYLGS